MADTEIKTQIPLSQSKEAPKVEPKLKTTEDVILLLNQYRETISEEVSKILTPFFNTFVNYHNVMKELGDLALAMGNSTLDLTRKFISIEEVISHIAAYAQVKKINSLIKDLQRHNDNVVTNIKNGSHNLIFIDELKDAFIAGAQGSGSFPTIDDVVAKLIVQFAAEPSAFESRYFNKGVLQISE